MGITINLFGVLLAGLSSMVIGALYYSPFAFGKSWRSLAKIDEQTYKKDTPKVMPLMLLCALVTAYVMAHFLFLVHAFTHGTWMVDSLKTALWVWVGFSATTLVVHNALDQRPLNLTLISLGNRLASLLAMGLILGWLHP